MIELQQKSTNFWDSPRTYPSYIKLVTIRLILQISKTFLHKMFKIVHAQSDHELTPTSYMNRAEIGQ